MTKADYLALAGFVSIAGGLWCVYFPLMLVFVGVVCLKLARTLGAKATS